MLWVQGMWADSVARRVGYSAGSLAAPTHVESHTMAPRSTWDFLEKLASSIAHISYCMFSLLLNRLSVLLSGCFKSLMDDERTFVNSLLRRGHFLLKKIINWMPEEEMRNERIFDDSVK